MRRIFVEWCVITSLVLALGVFLSQGQQDSVSGRLLRIDAAIYDFTSGWLAKSPENDPVIVEIDEDSLAQIGRWPWPRALHAAILQRLQAAGAKAIGLDILIIEQGPDDDILSAAILAGPPTVLPVASDIDRNGRAWPVYPVRQAGVVAGLGHAHFNFDSDGVVRGLYLEEGGLPAFSLAIMKAAGMPIADGPLTRASTTASPARRDQMLREANWPRSQFVLLPTVKNEWTRLSYGALLRGEIDNKQLQGRVVLIGASAAGMRDAYANTLISGQTISTGVSLHAAAISALSQGHFAQRLAPSWHHAIVLLQVLFTMVALYFSGPRLSLAITVIATLLVGLLSMRLLHDGVWIPPAGAMAAILIAYPLWSWRRLESVVAGLIEQSRQLRAEPTILSKASPSDDSTNALPATSRPRYFGLRLRAPVEPITMELRELRGAAEHIRSLRLLLATTLDRLPHPALVCNINFDILLRNRQARTSFTASVDDATPADRWLQAEFGDMPSFDALVEQHHQGSLERRDQTGRDWLIDVNRVQTSGLPTLWLLQFVDISPIRELQREREALMRFVSHDLRSPQISILSALSQMPAEHRSETTLAIENLASHSLALAESFVNWSRAENKQIDDTPIDLSAIATEAIDAVWPQSREHNISISLDCPEFADALGDAQLIRRAIGNLIDNAIKYGGDGKIVSVSIVKEDDTWLISVADQGPGLGKDDAAELFEPYIRGYAGSDRPNRRRSGTGLGLAFVRLVAERHHGNASATNSTDGGALFQIRLPVSP